MDAEFADPAWVFGRSSYGILADGRLAATARHDGRDHLYRIGPDGGVNDVATPYTEFEGLVRRRIGHRRRRRIARQSTVLARFDPATLAVSGIHRRASALLLDPAFVSVPESIQFQAADGRVVHALYYPPRNPEFMAPDRERPPLLVQFARRTHLERVERARSGQAAADDSWHRRRGRRLRRQHRVRAGTSRRALNGVWGVVDVDDCVLAAARFLVERGDVDRDRLAIMGGSAGGYTSLAALAFRNVLRRHRSVRRRRSRGPGPRHAQVRVALVDRLVGPRLGATELYRQHSQIHSSIRLPARSWSCRASTTGWCRRPRQTDLGAWTKYVLLSILQEEDPSPGKQDIKSWRSTAGVRRSSGDGMCAEETRRNTGDPAWRGKKNSTGDPRGGGRPRRESERSTVARKRVTSVERGAAVPRQRDKWQESGDWREPIRLHLSSGSCKERCMRKRREIGVIGFTRSTNSVGRMFWPRRGGDALPTAG